MSNHFLPHRNTDEFFNRIRVAVLRPGDKLILHVETPLTMEQQEHMIVALRSFDPNLKCAFINGLAVRMEDQPEGDRNQPLTPAITAAAQTET